MFTLYSYTAAMVRICTHNYYAALIEKTSAEDKVFVEKTDGVLFSCLLFALNTKTMTATRHSLFCNGQII